MPQANLEVVRSLMQAWEDVNLADVDWNAPEVAAGFQPMFTDDIEMHTLESGVGSGVAASYSGLDGLIRYLGEWFGPFSEYEIEMRDYLEHAGCVLVPSSQWGIGEGSGIRAELELTYLFRFRGGLISRVEQYDTLDEARSAA